MVYGETPDRIGRLAGLRQAALAVGLSALTAAVVLPFFGWGGLQTEGPCIAVLAGAVLQIVPVASRRWVAAVVAAAAASASVLIALRLSTSPSSSVPQLQALLRLALSRRSLAVALGGAVIVSVVALAETVEPAGLARLTVRLRPDAEQLVAWRATWRALVASRVLLWLVAVTAVITLGLHADVAGLSVERPFGRVGNTLIAPATAWDSSAYLNIAQHGYAGGLYFDAFFPGYPLLIRLVAWSPAAAVLGGIGISLVAFAAGLYLLHRLVSIDFGAKAAGTTVLVVAFFPTALFFSAVYTEAVFLALSIGAVWVPAINGVENPTKLAIDNLVDFAFLLFAIGSLIAAARRLPFAYLAYALASVAIPISSVYPHEPLASFPRYLAVIFPCQLSCALWIDERRWRRAWLPVSAALMALLASEFARGLWVA